MANTTYERRGEVHLSQAKQPDPSGIKRWRAYKNVAGAGKQNRVVAYGLSATLAEAALAKKLAAPGTARSIASDPRDLSVQRLLDGWLDYRIRTNHLRPASVRVYRYAADLIASTLGGARLGDLLATDVESALNRLRKADGRPLSVSVRSKAKVVLGAAIKWVAKDNPTFTYNAAALAEGVKGAPKHRKVSKNTDEIEAIWAAMPAGWLRRLVIIATTTGLRQAEALGLTESELDLTTSEARLTLGHQLSHSGGGRTPSGRNLGGSYSLAPCKTDEHDQPVGFDPQAFDPLAADAVRQELAKRVPYRPEPGDGPGLSGLIFTTALGRPRSGALVTRSFQQALKAEKLPPLRWHDLRGIWISRLADAGVPMERIAQAAHHSSSKTTEQSYYQTTTDQQTADLATLPTLHVPAD
jgi:integrase